MPGLQCLFAMSSGYGARFALDSGYNDAMLFCFLRKIVPRNENIVK